MPTIAPLHQKQLKDSSGIKWEPVGTLAEGSVAS